MCEDVHKCKRKVSMGAFITKAYCHIPLEFRCTRGKGQHPLLLLLTSVMKHSMLRMHCDHVRNKFIQTKPTTLFIIV